MVQPQGKVPQLRWRQRSVVIPSRQHSSSWQVIGLLANPCSHVFRHLPCVGPFCYQAFRLTDSPSSRPPPHGRCGGYLEKLAVPRDMSPRAGGDCNMKALTKLWEHRIAYIALCIAWAWPSSERSVISRGPTTELLRSRGGWCWGLWTVGDIEVESALWVKEMT